MNAIPMMKILLTTIMVPLFAMCSPKKAIDTQTMDYTAELTLKTDTTTLGAGCFWCTEAVFSRLQGVITVTPGYSGGTIANPTYREVCTGTTGHAEVARIVFDPAIISFAELLEVFWQMHDPTTLNRQGADHGTQYRSVIFYHNEQQKLEAGSQKEKLDKSGVFTNPVVTEISPVGSFYVAEDYHLNYYGNNRTAPYCRIIIDPKIQVINKQFRQIIKSE